MQGTQLNPGTPNNPIQQGTPSAPKKEKRTAAQSDNTPPRDLTHDFYLASTPTQPPQNQQH